MKIGYAFRMMICAMVFATGATAGDGKATASAQNDKKNVKMDFEGDVIERFGANPAMSDSVNIMTLQGGKSGRRLFKKKANFKSEIKQSIQEINDIP